MCESWKEYESNELTGKRSFFVSREGLVKKVYTGKEKEKIVEGTINNGYKAVWVTRKDGKRTAQYVHKMVGEVFIPNPEGKQFVIHLDHDKLNNNVSNLQWADLEEWKKHNKHLFRMMKGRSRLDNLPNSKLSEKEVIKLKKKLVNYKKEVKISQLAKEFKISQGQVYRILRGENWSHIQVDRDTK